MNRYWRTLRMVCMVCEMFWWRRVPPGSWKFHCGRCQGPLVPVYEEGHEHRNPYLR